MAYLRKSVGHTAEKTPLTPNSLDEATAETCLQSSDPGSLSALTPGGRLRDNDILTGRFRIIRFIAAGGMGEVYEVEDQRLQGVRLALKTILPHIAARPDMQERFEREVLLARRVSHPNLCPIYDIFHCRHQEDDLIFLTMKLLSGETLSARIARDGPIPLDEAGRIVEQVAAALGAAHEAGILHRDIKTANIMLDGSGPSVRACVTDFGLARAYQSESTILTADGIAGTPGYLAPELFQGEPPSTATDVYAFGVVVYKMLSGHAPPFRGNARDPFMDQLPANWRRFIESCLQPEPSLRSQNLPDVLSSLSGSGHPRRTLPALTRRHFLAAGAGTLAAAAIGGIWFNWPRIEDLFEPLPAKRFVALMAWPTAGSTPVLATVLDSIGSRLAREEATVKDLLVVKPSDLPPNGGSLSHPSESIATLGANLVLAASMQSTSTAVTLTLQILEAGTQRVLRHRRISRKVSELSSLGDEAGEAAASLLGLAERQSVPNDPEQLQRVPPQAFSLFSEAEQLMAQPNEVGLTDAISKYLKALEIDPDFALAHAKLAIADAKQNLHADKPTYIPAMGNADAALRLNPGSAKALLSKAIVLLYTGDADQALIFFQKALNADPEDTETLLYRAQAYRDQGKLDNAQKVYRDLLYKRPNYWLAYNELGYMLNKQGHYSEAADNFKAASDVAPEVALPLSNLGTTYFQLKNRAEAKKYCALSVRKGPNLAAWMLLGDMAFEDKKYEEALNDYEAASLIKPGYHLIWRNIGDCYQVEGDRKKMIESYKKAADILETIMVTHPKSALGWATLAFYHAKIGERTKAEIEIAKWTSLHAEDLASQFMMVQALTLLDRKEQALKLLLTCVDRNLSPEDIGLAIDLKDLVRDARYVAHVRGLQRKNGLHAS